MLCDPLSAKLLSLTVVRLATATAPSVITMMHHTLSPRLQQDVLWNTAAILYQGLCLCALGLLLQHPLSQQQAFRTVFGLLVFIVLLVGQPFIYATETQPFAIGTASSCAIAAWSILDWTFNNTAKKPTVAQVLLSTLSHPMQGVCKVYKRMHQKAPQSTSKPPTSKGPGRPLIIVDAAGGLDAVPESAGLFEATCPQYSQAPAADAIRQAALSLIAVMASYDVGLFLLCHFSNGMCSGNMAFPAATLPLATPAASGLLQQLPAFVAPPFMARAIFALAAGSLLPLQMEMMYISVRMDLLIAGMWWPQAAAYAEQLPKCAFNWPMASRSISELWGFRWHQFLRYYFQGLGRKAVGAVVPPGKVVPPSIRSSLHTVAAFAMSGIMHEYLTWAAFGTVTGYYMAFFGLHCVAVLLEGWAVVLAAVLSSNKASSRQARTQISKQDAVQDKATTAVSATFSPNPVNGAATAAADAKVGSTTESIPQSSVGKGIPAANSWKLPVWVKHLWTLSVMTLLGPLFVEPYRVAGYFGHRAFHPMGFSVTGRMVQWAAQHLHASLGFAIFSLAM